MSMKTKSKKPKYRPKKESKSNLEKESLKKDIMQWLIFSIIFILFIAWLTGMAKIYYPDPISLGFGQYLDISTALIYFGLAVWSLISILIFKRVI